MIKTGNRHQFASWGVLAFVVLFAGCEKNEFISEENGNYIDFAVTEGNLLKEPATRTVSNKEETDLPLQDFVTLKDPNGKEMMTLCHTVQPMSANFVENPSLESTRSAPVTGSNINDRYSSSIYATALRNNGNVFIPQQTLEWKSTSGSTSYWKTTACRYLWPSESLRFWAWAPKEYVSGVTFASDGKSMSFNYATPSSLGWSTDAEAQPDLIVANKVANMSTSAGKVELVFDHALTAIRFEFAKTEACTVKSITLRNVLAKGTCTYNPENTNPIVWSELSIPKDFKQTFDQSIEEVSEGESRKPIYKNSPENDVATFMVIPQSTTTTNTISLEIHCTVGDSDIPLIKELTFDDTNWKVGMIHTYTLYR